MTRIKMFVDVDDQERICLRNTGVQRVEELRKKILLKSKKRSREFDQSKLKNVSISRLSLQLPHSLSKMPW